MPAYPSPSPATKASRTKVTRDEWNALVNAANHLHGDDGAIAFVHGATFTKSQNSQLLVAVDNVNAGTGAYSELAARNAAADTAALRLLCLGTGWTTDGAFVQDGGVLDADTALSGGLSIVARHATTGHLRFYTGGSAAADERLRIPVSTTDSALQWLLAGSVGWSMGIDDSDSDKFKLSRSATLGTSDVFSVTPGSSDMTFSGNLLVGVGQYFGQSASANVKMTAAGTVLQSQSILYLVIDADNTETGAWFSWQHNATDGGGTEIMRLTDAGTLYIGDTSNLKMTTGLTINQLGADDEALALKSDIAHGMTDNAEPDTYGKLSKVGGASGGLTVAGYSSGLTGLGLVGYHHTDDTTKTTSARGNVEVYTGLRSGTSITDPGANANIVVFKAGTSARFVFDAEGSAHGDVEWTTFDAHDDLAVLDAFQIQAAGTTPRLTPERYGGSSLAYGRDWFETHGIVGRDSWHTEGGKQRQMVNFSRLAMLHHGALLQLAERSMEERAEIETLRQEVARLNRLLSN